MCACEGWGVHMWYVECVHVWREGVYVVYVCSVNVCSVWNVWCLHVWCVCVWGGVVSMCVWAVL